MLHDICRKNTKITEFYMICARKWPNFTWYLPENARIFHDVCPKNNFPFFFWGGGHVPLLSSRLLRQCVVIYRGPSPMYGSHQCALLSLRHYQWETVGNVDWLKFSDHLTGVYNNIIHISTGQHEPQQSYWYDRPAQAYSTNILNRDIPVQTS